MSVFQTLKGKFQNVQQDITASFRSLRQKKSKLSPLGGRREPKICFDAGAELLSRYQEQWMLIHENSECNAKKAEEVDSKISYMFLLGEHQNSLLSELTTGVTDFPALTQQIQTIMDHIGVIDLKFSAIEEMMIGIEDCIEQEEIQRNKKHHEFLLANYKQRRDVDLEKVKVSLAKQHVEAVQALELERKAELKERRKAYEMAFSEDIKLYKEFGMPNKFPFKPEDVKTTLSEITIEEDRQALDEFLRTEDIQSPTSGSELTDMSDPQSSGNIAEYSDHTGSIPTNITGNMADSSLSTNPTDPQSVGDKNDSPVISETVAACNNATSSQYDT